VLFGVGYLDHFCLLPIPLWLVSERKVRFITKGRFEGGLKGQQKKSRPVKGGQSIVAVTLYT